MAGYIKIYRDILNTGLLYKPAMLQVWIYLNDRAQYTRTVKDGIELLPGQLLVSASEIARTCHVNADRVQYVLKCFEEQGIISRENIRNRYTLITLTNPDELRCVKQTDLHNPTVRATQNAEPQPEKVQKSAYGVCGNVYLSAEEKEMLKQRSPAADSYIDRLSAYKRRTNKTYNDDFAVLCEWISKDEINEAAKPAPAVSKPVKENRPNPSLSRYQDMNTDFFTAPASYDLERAERLARERVPTLKKRPKP